MINEVLLIASLVFFYGTVIAFYKFFGKEGMFVWMALATVLANTEVLRVVEAFGIEQTLGNVLFGSTFLAVQILNENESKKAAAKCVLLGIFSAVIFAFTSQAWILVSPSPSDITGSAFRTIFSMTPRVVASSIAAFALCHFLDLWLYRKIWNITTKLSGSEKKFLWVRNNGSTIICQIVNTVTYTLGTFYGIYSRETLISICISSFVIFLATSLCDTPAIYLSRHIRNRRNFRDGKSFEDEQEHV